jgi:hypothetical protein
LVSFDSNIMVDFPLTNLTSEGKGKCLALVQRIQAGSNTNLSGGLFQGLQLLLEQKEWAERCAVCLLTDGQLNEGITDSSKLLGMLGSTLHRFGQGTSKRAPPSVMTFGYGKDASVEILTSIASKSGGNYYSILSTEAVPLAFADALGGLLAVVAQNVSVKVIVEGATALTPLTKFEFLTPSANTALLNLKDLYAGESRDILFKVTYGASKAPITVKFEVSYLDVIKEEVGAKAECVSLVHRVPSNEISPEVKDDVEVARHQLRWDALVALAEASTKADAGDVGGGGRTIGMALSSIQHRMADLGIAEDEDDMMGEVASDMRTAALGMSSKTTWNESRGKTAAASYSHSHQRSNKTEELLNVKSSPFMMAAAAAAPVSSKPKTESSYSVPAKTKMFQTAKSAFNLQ